MACNWTTKPNGVVYYQNPTYTDPVQGNARNCYLVASLASMAWVNPANIAKKIVTTSKNGQTGENVSFTQGPGTVFVSRKLCLDAGGNFQYCRSSQAGSGEIWPSIYEKAYARAFLIPGGPTESNWDTFNMDAVAWEGNSMNGLSRLISGAAAQYAASSIDSAGIIPAYVDSFGKTKYPAIAWTPPGSNPQGISSDHTYSILGFYPGSSGPTHVILRDPRASGKPTTGVLGLGTWTLGANNYYTGPNPDASYGIPSNAIPLSNGAFGLQVSVFKQYFQSFGFVK
jgi:hypothetical protein